jgi:hypothetical protein
MYHFESQTRGNVNHSEKSAQRSLRERAYIENKWSGIIRNDPCYNPNLSVWMPFEALRIDDDEIGPLVQEKIRNSWV